MRTSTPSYGLSKHLWRTCSDKLCQLILPRACWQCRKEDSEPGVKLGRCRGCLEIFFCSPECQRAAWKRHKKYCKAAAANREELIESLDELSRSCSGGEIKAAVVNYFPDLMNVDEWGKESGINPDKLVSRHPSIVVHRTRLCYCYAAYDLTKDGMEPVEAFLNVRSKNYELALSPDSPHKRVTWETLAADPSTSVFIKATHARRGVTWRDLFSQLLAHKNGAAFECNHHMLTNVMRVRPRLFFVGFANAGPMGEADDAAEKMKRDMMKAFTQNNPHEVIRG
ncbi:unnamed protein product [Vitrella brassicaformis CCMP3155]|uniref:MYND-type domain-containing protein n=1 Tax=Vitrella brassicaformis (strain CCMP3155) TaxID=1169540 RepID=A0A0G4EM27_VITBC|nr:unnamed protein product [Vitrella brassicaformis CCMP3155]|eukprot:CEL98193.1 unnamed protein product [Vitrella brassicaformis CCMP3155]